MRIVGLVLLVISLIIGIVKEAHSMTFESAKKELKKLNFDKTTVYCSCEIKKNNGKWEVGNCPISGVDLSAKRSKVIEWEHIVPAENFGRFFPEWRKCGDGKSGRKCAKKNAKYAEMEGDPFNLWPEVGTVNMIRSNKKMGVVQGGVEIKGCGKYNEKTFEPSLDHIKGLVARVHLYMNGAYFNFLSDKDIKLYQAWDKMYPPSKLECERMKSIQKIYKEKKWPFFDRC